MLQLRAFVPPGDVGDISNRLLAVEGVSHLIVGGTTHGGLTQLTCEIDPTHAEAVLEVLRSSNLASDDVTLIRETSVAPIGWRRRRPDTGRGLAAWTEVVGRAHENSRTATLFVLYMAAAGVVAGVGVLNDSSILIVGAMALSPDLLPIAAATVGLVGRRWRLALRSLVTLWLGLAVTTSMAGVTTAALRLMGRIDADIPLNQTALGLTLVSVEPGGVLVALAAGMAGMLAFETAGSAAVGVAISVTTIPAAAFMGAAFGLQGYQDAFGALDVLLVNVVCVFVGSTMTLLVQRWRRAS